MYKKDTVKPNMKFGRLITVRKAGIANRADLWECQCQCGKYHKVRVYHLLSGSISSCGCLQKEAGKKRGKNKKYNTYDLTGEFGIGYTHNKQPFYFDLEDYEKIKEYSWHINEGYVIAKGLKELNRKKVSFHQLVLNTDYKNTGIEIDHINRNGLDNRKTNLRKVSHIDNAKNSSIGTLNKTGIIGVCIEKKCNKYRADITNNRTRIFLGYYDNLEEAAFARLKAEKELFGEFSPQSHLFEQYGA